MRPARKGPENRRPANGMWRAKRGFNEAGPQGAGKPPGKEANSENPRVGFNEAGPQGAGKPALSAGGRDSSNRFNEAGPQGAGKPRSTD